MNIFGKKISEVEYGDIKKLVDSKTPESTYLDYKKEMQFTQGAKEELGRDVSAFANSEGGTLILGVEEKKVKKNAKLICVEPGSISGIPQIHNQQETGIWLEQAIKATTKRMVNTHILSVDIHGEESNRVFVIYVPKATMPHIWWRAVSMLDVISSGETSKMRLPRNTKFGSYLKGAQEWNRSLTSIWHS